MLRMKSKYFVHVLLLFLFCMICFKIREDVFAAKAVNRQGEAISRFWAMLLVKGEVCKLWTSRHDILINNMNTREEYIHVSVARNKVSQDCDWSTAVCMSGEFEDEAYPLITPASHSRTDLPQWGKLSLFSWDLCGKIENTLTLSIFEARVEGIEAGVCLARDKWTGNCVAFGAFIQSEEGSVFADKQP